MLLRHFEKGILGLAAFFLVCAVATPLLARPGELAVSTQIAALDEMVEAHFANYQLAPLPVPDELGHLRAETRVPEPAPEFPGWLAHRRPSLICSIAPKPELPEPEHLAPTLSLEVEHGRVTLTFGPAKSGNGCNVTGYEVSRVDSGGNVVLLAKPTEAGTFVDDKVESRATYVYRVLERAEAPPGYAALPTAKIELTAEQTANVPREFIIVPDREVVTVDGQPEAKLYVYRWRQGSWIRAEVWHVRVGQVVAKRDSQGHEVFSTGAEVVSIEQQGKEARVGIRWASKLVETLSSKDTYSELAGARR